MSCEPYNRVRILCRLNWVMFQHLCVHKGHLVIKMKTTLKCNVLNTIGAIIFHCSARYLWPDHPDPYRQEARYNSKVHKTLQPLFERVLNNLFWESVSNFESRLRFRVTFVLSTIWRWNLLMSFRPYIISLSRWQTKGGFTVAIKFAFLRLHFYVKTLECYCSGLYNWAEVYLFNSDIRISQNSAWIPSTLVQEYLFLIVGFSG